MGKLVRLPTGGVAESPLIVRVAGVPMTTLARSRCAESAKRARELARLRVWLRREGSDLADALHAAIGGLPPGGLKPQLVGLRRSLHQVRRPVRAEWNDRIAAVLPASDAERVHGWLRELGEADRLRTRLAETLAVESNAAREALRAGAAHAHFRRALSQSSPTLAAELDKWLADPQACPRRQSLVRLTKYLSRAAAKTSPYSTFTVSGVATWRDNGPPVWLDRSAPVSGVLELHGTLVRDLVTALGERPDAGSAGAVRPDAMLVVNPSATIHDGTVLFLGRGAREPIIAVPADEALLACMRVARETGGCTIGELRARLAVEERDGRLDRFMSGLVTAGLFDYRPVVADQAPDALAELACRARGGDADGVEIARLLDDVRAELSRPVQPPDVDGHVRRQRNLRSAADTLAARLQISADLGKGLFHENAVFTRPAAACAISDWRPALADLDVVRRLLAVADPALPLRLALGRYAGERFGGGATVPWMTLYRAMHGESADASDPAAREVHRLLRIAPGAPAPLAASPLARLRELSEIRSHTWRILRDTGRLDAKVIADQVADWPDWITPPPRMCFYTQAFEDAGTLRLAVNVTHAGHGRGRSRLARLIPLAGGPAPDWRHRPAAEPAPDEPVPAELCGMFGAADNVRAPSLPLELDYPYTASRRPATERIVLGDLTVVHNPETDLVWLTAPGLGPPLRPMHLGMMADPLLPPMARLLTAAFGGGYYLNAALQLPLATAAGTVGVTASQRIEVGRIVLRRATWTTPREAIPARHPADTDADYLTRLVGWLDEHGIPLRCFVRTWPGDPRDPNTAQWARGLLGRSRKPLYVDFANLYLLLAFERILPDPDHTVMFEEALPDPEDGRFGAAEFVVEVGDA
jgi:hypothetical protein